MRWVTRLVIALPLLRLIPPKDFFTTASGDPNFRQMALLVLLGGALWMLSPLARRLSERWQMGLSSAALFAGSLAGWAGLLRTQLLLDNFEMHVTLGPGLPLYALASLGAVAVAALPAAVRRWTLATKS